VPWPSCGFVTLKQILGKHGGPIPLGLTRWWEGVKTGEFPAPLKLGGRTVWRVSDINRLIEELDSTQPGRSRASMAEPGA
jgi:predicted DNA-binding transcriptional regulator AlpA